MNWTMPKRPQRVWTAEQIEVAPGWKQPKKKVRDVRTRAAATFGTLVGERLADLAMPGARVEIRVAPDGAGDPIEAALGANVGEAVLPLAKAASGGELARAMLAIRLVAMGGPQTMVFDEVDAGVGGAAALSLGEALHEVSRSRQVLVVTHLAQVAAKADRQITVRKDEVLGRTLTSAVAVAGEERVIELSRMLSGHPRQRRRPGARPGAPRRLTYLVRRGYVAPMPRPNVLLIMTDEERYAASLRDGRASRTSASNN